MDKRIGFGKLPGMLTSLRIRNLALMEDLRWEPGPGLNILTGETGAGKSILIDALSLLLGERADRTMIREGAEECQVEGVMTLPPHTRGLLTELGLEAADGEISLRRTFSINGQNRQWINGSPVTLTVLKKLGDNLADIHGPHDHQSLLRQEAQLDALDAFGHHEAELHEVAAVWEKMRRLEQEEEQLAVLAGGDLEQKLDFLDHQIREIEQAAPQPGEDEELAAAYRAASHAQRIAELAAAALAALGEAEGNVTETLARVQKSLQEWQGLDSASSGLAEANAAIVAQVRDLQQDIQTRLDAVELDQEALARMEERLNILQLLKRKYGGTLDAVLERLESLKSERTRLGGLDEHRARLRKDMEAARATCQAACLRLSQRRRDAAPRLASAVSAQLRELGFLQASFNVRLEDRPSPTGRGQDTVEFEFAPNPGEPARPLRAIASSGEMARVMLALKSVLAEQDRVPVLIFDEVDANVGGQTAVAVGQRLRRLARSHQVLCITHLPQVAAAGDRHFQVEKTVADGRTIARLEELAERRRLDELARMLGGSLASARKLAADMLKQSREER